MIEDDHTPPVQTARDTIALLTAIYDSELQATDVAHYVVDELLESVVLDGDPAVVILHASRLAMYGVRLQAAVAGIAVPDVLAEWGKRCAGEALP
jgi:hypothetical protein